MVENRIEALERERRCKNKMLTEEPIPIKAEAKVFQLAIYRELDIVFILDSLARADEVYDEVFGLLERRTNIADDLTSRTDEELERLRYYETVILPVCPISRVVKSVEDLLRTSEPLTELCERRDCPEFKTCWATESLEPPTTYIDSPPPCFKDKIEEEEHR